MKQVQTNPDQERYYVGYVVFINFQSVSQSLFSTARSQQMLNHLQKEQIKILYISLYYIIYKEQTVR